jgi:hypothetical protein
VIARQRCSSIDLEHLLQGWPGQPIPSIIRPVGERRHEARQTSVPVGLGEFTLPSEYLFLAQLDSTVAKHDVRKIDIKLVRGHIRIIQVS